MKRRGQQAPGAPRAALPGLALGAALAWLGGCSGGEDRPKENPAPARVVRVHGVADPSLSIAVQVEYFTAAAGCRRASSLLRRLDGAAVPQRRIVDVPVARARDGRYEAGVPLDQFEPGECGWHPFVIAFQVRNQAGTSTGQVMVDGAGRSALQPGAQGAVWIDSPVRREAMPGQALPAGRLEVPAVQMQCKENTVRGTAVLNCVTERPGMLTVIREQAAEVEVNFRDAGASGDAQPEGAGS